MRSKCAIALTVLAAMLTFGAGSGAGAGGGLKGFEPCGKVPDQGSPAPVKAANVRCERARKLASRFISSDELASGWRTYNPAGCEFFMYKRGEKRELLDWFEDRGRPETKLIYLIKTRGCVS